MAIRTPRTYPGTYFPPAGDVPLNVRRAYVRRNRFIGGKAVELAVPEVELHYTNVTYEGRVLATRERNGYHDSDFDALVWTEDGKPRWVEYDTTRGAGGGTAKVDATDEVKAAYADYRDKYVAAQKAERAREDAARVAKGKRVRVVKGRKVPVGTEGVVFWIGDSRWGLRVGLRPNRFGGEAVFTSIDNVEVVGDDGETMKQPGPEGPWGRGMVMSSLPDLGRPPAATVIFVSGEAEYATL